MSEKKNLKLRVNCEHITSNKEQIIEECLAKLKKDDGFDILRTNIRGINHMRINEVIVLGNNWIIYKNIAEYYQGTEKKLEKILKDKSNNQTWSRDVHIKCESAKVNQFLLQITIVFNDSIENYLIIDKEGKNFECKFANLFSYNWNANSPEQIKKMLNRRETEILI